MPFASNFKILENPLAKDPQHPPVIDVDMGEFFDYDAFFDKADDIEYSLVGNKIQLNSPAKQASPSNQIKKKQKKRDPIFSLPGSPLAQSYQELLQLVDTMKITSPQEKRVLKSIETLSSVHHNILEEPTHAPTNMEQ